MRWDADYLYIGAQVLEPFIYADYSHGHNTVAPYHDNDFEVFIDVSGTTQYYKEFEMNAINATYDVSADTLVVNPVSRARSSGPPSLHSEQKALSAKT